MLAGVQIVCFAASYAVAFLLEVSRMVFRSGVRGAVMLGFAGAGFVAHSAFLYYRALEAPGSPLSSEQDWYLLAAWLLVVVYLYLVWYHPRQSFGLFLLPLVLGLIAAGAFLARSEPFAREPASHVWGIIHGTAVLLATVAVLAGFAAGVMYVYQDRRLKRKLPLPRGLRLPSLEWLARANHRALVVAVLMLAIGVAAGVVLNAFRQAGGLNLLPWHDPVVFASFVMLLWLLSAVALAARYPAQRQGRKVAHLTLVSFIFLLVALSAMLLLDTAHGGRNQTQKPTHSGSSVSRCRKPLLRCRHTACDACYKEAACAQKRKRRNAQCQTADDMAGVVPRVGRELQASGSRGGLSFVLFHGFFQTCPCRL